ncbi:hypothetical protein Tco_0242086, partial [Tanacetum coccineum]
SAIKKLIIVPSSYQPKKTHKPRKAIRTIEISQTSRPINLVVDETVYKEWEDRMERAATTTFSLEVEQDSESKTSRHVKRGRDTKIRQSSCPPVKVGDEVVHKELGDRMERVATIASSLEAEQDNGSYGKSTIYVSLIHQFWQTAFASTSENGEIEITDTINGRVKTVTEASIRRHLKLEDSNGSTVPVESHHTPTSAPSTSQPPTSPPSMQTTHVAEEAATMPHDSPLLRVHSLGSDEGSMTLHELTVLCTTLSKKVESLESDLKQTKLTYDAVKKLENIIKSSKARRRVRLIVSEDEDDLEDPSKQGRKIAQLDEDEGITLVQMGAQTQGRHEHDLEPDFEFTAPEEVYTAEPDISTANVPVSTAGAEVSTASPEVKTAAESLVYIRRSAAKRKDKGKAIMKEAEPVQKKTKLQLEQERLGYEEALRLQEQLDEEERQRIARVHEEANTFNAEEWDNIQAQIEAGEELAQKLQAEERGKFFEVKKARLLIEMINERKRLFAQQRAEQRRNKPMTQAQQRTYMCNYIKNMGSHTLQQLKKLSFDEIKELFETTMNRVKDFVPMESDRLVPRISTRSSKRTAETELGHEGSKRQKTNEEQSVEEENKLSE